MADRALKIIIKKHKWPSIVIFASLNGKYIGGVVFTRSGVEFKQSDDEAAIKSPLELLNAIYECIGKITVLY